MNANPGYDIIAYGESGWLARFKDGGDPVALALFANAAAALLREQDGVLDAVAGLDSLAVRFAPQRMTAEAARSALENAITAARLAPGQSVTILLYYKQFERSNWMPERATPVVPTGMSTRADTEKMLRQQQESL